MIAMLREVSTLEGIVVQFTDAAPDSPEHPGIDTMSVVVPGSTPREFTAAAMRIAAVHTWQQIGFLVAAGHQIDNGEGGEWYARFPATRRALRVASDGRHVRVLTGDGDEISYYDATEFARAPGRTLAHLARTLLGGDGRCT